MTRASLVAIVALLGATLAVRAEAQDDASSARSRRAERLVRTGDAKVRAGDAGSALGFYREAVGADPRHVAAYEGLARAYLLADRPQDALETLRVASARIPRSLPLTLLRAKILRDTGSGAEALALLRTLVQWAPADARVHAARAEAARGEGAWSEALASYRAIVRLGEEDGGLAPLAEEAKRYIRALMRLATLDPASACEGSSVRESLCGITSEASDRDATLR